MFRFFRRYQKTFIVVGGVILMFVFTIGDSLTGMFQGGGPDRPGRAPGEMAVSWEGGELTNAQLGQLYSRALVLDQFVGQMYGAGRAVAAEEGLDHLPPNIRVVGRLMRDRRTGELLQGQAIEEQIVSKHILAEKAREQGFQISDETILQYIEDLGWGNLNSDTIAAIIESSNQGGRPPTVNQILGALRDELLAVAMETCYTAPLHAELPINRWEDWRRVNDRVVIEAAAIDPQDLLIDVPDPTEEELRDFYDKYKLHFPVPRNVSGVELPQPTPGFRIPRQIRLQYLRANYDEFIERYADEVTEEEVAKYYEENKFRFVAAQDFDEEEEESSDSEEESSEEEQPEEEAADEESTEETEAPVEQEGSDESEGESAEENSEEENAEKGTAALERPFRLTAYQEEAENGEASSEEEATDDVEESSTTEDSESDETESSDLEEPPPVEYQPLEEVADKIRTNIAQDRFFNEIDDTMAAIVERLHPHFTKYLQASLDAEGEDQEPPKPSPELVDLTPLAQEFSLEYEQTGELNRIAMSKSDVGKSVEDEKYRAPLWRVVFDADVDLYEPMICTDAGRFGDKYLVMVLSDEPARSPAFEEIREEVTKAWKRAETAKLALKRAEKLAKEAQKAGLTLEDFFLDDDKIEVTETEPFTYITVGDVAPMGFQPEYRLSQPKGVTSVGPNFMDEVSKLKVGQVAAVQNHDHSIAYLIRIADPVETEEELRSDFLEDANFWDGRAAFLSANRQHLQQAVINEVFDAWDIKFNGRDESE